MYFRKVFPSTPFYGIELIPSLYCFVTTFDVLLPCERYSKGDPEFVLSFSIELGRLLVSDLVLVRRLLGLYSIFLQVFSLYFIGDWAWVILLKSLIGFSLLISKIEIWTVSSISSSRRWWTNCRDELFVMRKDRHQFSPGFVQFIGAGFIELNIATNCFT